MERIKYGPGEFTGEFAEDRFGKAPVFHPPISVRENFEAMFKGKNPLWMPMTSDSKSFDPRIDPDNIARAFVFDGEGPYDVTKYGGPDMFGIEWVFVPVAGGSMENPDNPHPLEDANDWREVIKFPDVNAWDWERSAKANAEWFETNKDYVQTITFLNGTGFERLVSFMGFENAATALIDDEQQEAVIELCTEIMEKVYFPYIDNVAKWYPSIDKISLHDDWGAQRAPFFSLAAAREVFVPIYKRFTDYVKSKGKIIELAMDLDNRDDFCREKYGLSFKDIDALDPTHDIEYDIKSGQVIFYLTHEAKHKEEAYFILFKNSKNIKFIFLLSKIIKYFFFKFEFRYV